MRVWTPAIYRLFNQIADNRAMTYHPRSLHQDLSRKQRGPRSCNQELARTVPTSASQLAFGALLGIIGIGAFAAVSSADLGLMKDRSSELYFSYCAEAWAARLAPMRRWQPGYRAGLDPDADGVACEPYR